MDVGHAVCAWCSRSAALLCRICDGGGCAARCDLWSAAVPGSVGDILYDVAIRALDEQEREVAGVSRRTGTLTASTAVAATVLGGAAFDGPHPLGRAAWAATAFGIGGAVVVCAASVHLLRSHRLRFSIDARQITGLHLQRDARADDLRADLALALARRVERNARSITAMHGVFAIALGGFVCELVGLGLAAALA
ncbi:MAG TPA: hypothetical protein VGM33_13700 [Baekduia sp.]|jgi:hypothetical protein